MLRTSALAEAVDAIVQRAGERIACATPLGLGKPVPLLNALYQRVRADPRRHLSIFTALSLEIPRAAGELERRFPPGAELAGMVKRLESFGAFVEIAPGLEGLLHVSELGRDRRIAHPREVVSLGQELRVRVKAVEADKRRISLVLAPNAAEARPEEVERYAPERQSAGFGALGDFLGKKPRS